VQYQVLNHIRISGKALLSNYRYFQSLQPHAGIAPVLKANAYGHGLLHIAKFIEQSLPDAPFICVDSLYEAYELMKGGITKDIFIMGYTDPHNYQVWKKLPFIFSVWDTETLYALNKHQPGARIHLKLDTGMHRLGLNRQALPKFLHALNMCRSLQVEGVYSHLSQADNPQPHTFTQNQLKLFKKLVAELESHGLNFTWRHLSATAGATVISDPYLNLIRLGIGFYGYTPFAPRTKQAIIHKQHLSPALTLTSHIAHLQTLNPGDEVGYGGTYQAKQTEVAAILPLGYYEGINRDLSNRALFTHQDTPCPVIGRVSMNMCTIKIPRTTSVRVGDPITLISADPAAPNSLYQLVSILKTIPYTILTGLHSSIRRELI